MYFQPRFISWLYLKRGSVQRIQMKQKAMNIVFRSVIVIPMSVSATPPRPTYSTSSAWPGIR